VKFGEWDARWNKVAGAAFGQRQMDWGREWGGPLALEGILGWLSWAYARGPRSDPGWYGTRRWRWGGSGSMACFDSTTDKRNVKVKFRSTNLICGVLPKRRYGCIVSFVNSRENAGAAAKSQLSCAR